MHWCVLDSECLDYTELLNILVTDVKGEYLAKKTENSKVLVKLLDTDVEKFDDYGCPEFILLLIVKEMKKSGFLRTTHWGIRLHFTVQSAREKWLLTDQGSIWVCKLCNLKWIISIYVYKSFENSQFFCRTPYWVNEHMSQMIDQEEIFELSKNVFEGKNQKKNRGFVRENLFQIFDYLFVHTFCHFVDYLRLFLESLSLENLWRIICLSKNSVWCSRIQFTTLTKTMNSLVSTKNREFLSLVGPPETGKCNWFLLVQIGTVEQNFDKLFLPTLPATLYCYAKTSWKFRVCPFKVGTLNLNIRWGKTVH